MSIDCNSPNFNYSRESKVLNLFQKSENIQSKKYGKWGFQKSLDKFDFSKIPKSKKEFSLIKIDNSQSGENKSNQNLERVDYFNFQNYPNSKAQEYLAKKNGKYE